MKSRDIVKCISKEANKAPFYGQVAEVKNVYREDDIMTLEGYGNTPYDVKDFVVYRSFEEAQDIPQGLPLDIYEAFFVIQQWNQHHTQSMNIRVDAGDPREGGTLFMIGEQYDTHDPMEALKFILDFCVRTRDARTLEMCAAVLQAQRKLF